MEDERREKLQALLREQAALKEKEIAMKEKEAALQRENQALQRENQAVQEKAALAEIERIKALLSDKGLSI
ncbi:hypothetical protein CCP3SC5AM1_1400001 [Gammaproteobacteria bacterium]